MRVRRVWFLTFLFLVAVSAPASADDDAARLFDLLKGGWIAQDADVVDMGHCIAEESVKLQVDVRRLEKGRIVGTYTESAGRRAAYRACEGLGAYEAEYAFSIDVPASGAATGSPLIAALKLLNCRPERHPMCLAAEPDLMHPVAPPSKHGSPLLFGGVAFSRAR